jgi:hypothetical protein
MKIFLDGYEFRRGTGYKKYDVFSGGKKIASFGDSRYEHYRDRIGLWSRLNHGDEKRRKAYMSRHHPGQTREEALRTTPKTSAKYFSTKYLW